MDIEFLFLITSSVQLSAFLEHFSGNLSLVRYVLVKKKKLEPRDICLFLYILVSSY